MNPIKIRNKACNLTNQISRYEFGTGFRPLCSKLGGLPGSLTASWGAGVDENEGGGEVGIAGDIPR